MATSLPHTDQLVDLTTCPVCLVRYDRLDRRPKFLQCSHTVCISCLQKMFQNGALLCPVCRVPSQVPNVGVRGIPNNHYALLLIESLSSPRAESSSKATSTCEEASKNKDALGPGPSDWCFTCMKPAAPLCSLSKYHTTSLLPAEGVRLAQKLQTSLDETKQNWATAATERRRIQGHFQSALNLMKNLQVSLESDIEENDSHLAELISLLDFVECDDSITADNYERKAAEYQQLFTQSASKVSAANSMNFKADDTSVYGPIVNYISYLKKSKKTGTLKEPLETRESRTSSGAENPSPRSPASCQPPAPPQTALPEPCLNRLGPIVTFPWYKFTFSPPSLVQREFRLDMKLDGAFYGTAKLVLQLDLPILTSCLNTYNSCLVKSAHPNVFVAVGDFVDAGNTLPDLQNLPFASTEGSAGMFSLTQSKSSLTWSFIVITGPLKVTPKKTRTFARVTNGLDVFNKLSNLGRDKDHVLEFRWIPL